jgi:hypothetical protein
MPTKSALPGARRADVTGFGVREHHGWLGLANARPMRLSIVRVFGTGSGLK